MSSDAQHDDEEEDDEAEAAAAELMASVQRGFEKAKRAGVPAAKRLMKELQSACASAAGYEIRKRAQESRASKPTPSDTIPFAHSSDASSGRLGPCVAWQG